jgi:predicted RNA binding protein YcfA (HicA-like mRNA interferase family)
MKTISGKNFCKLPEKKGWVLARINGNHPIYTRAVTIYRISVPIHKNNDLKAGLLKSFMKIAEISESDL